MILREKLVAIGLLIGVGLAVPVDATAQVQVPKPAPTPAAKPAASPSPAAKPAAGAPAPRAGGFPMELAVPLLASGAAAVGGGVYLLRRGKQ
jgi:hypothetical protein